MRRNRRWMKRELKGRITLNGLLEIREHKISVVKSMKYNKEKKKGQIVRNKINRLYDTDQRKVYNTFREILKNGDSDDVSFKTRSDKTRSQTTLTKEDFEDYWPKIWREESKVNLEAKWIKDVEQAISQSTAVNDDEIVNITKEKFTNMLETKKNWSSPGKDKIVNYWLKAFTTIHEGISVAVTELINKQTPIPTWLLEGRCGLHPKKLQPKAPDHRPITCLNTMYKSITSLVGEYLPLKTLQMDQRGGRPGVMGCTDNMLIDKMILEDAKMNKNNLSMVWTDDIGKEVRKATRLMLQQLLQQLKGNIQLPACLRIIGYLRQLETFSEADLRIKFLQARDSWFQSVLSAIPDKDAYYHITKIIEASRVHLFDIVTQYRAIFSDDDPIFIMEEERAVNYSNILHAWISRKITDFMSTLNKDMNRGVAGRLDSLLSQCMYFGLSFSRVGADFRCLLMPIFNRVVMKTFVQNLETTTKAFEESLMTFSAPKSHVQLDSQRQASKMKTSESSLSPPQELLDFSPLAHYTNGILTCFNELRSFASIPLSKLVRGRLQASLERVSVAIASWTRLETQSQIKKDGSNILVLTRLAIEEFFPYINRCYQAVFKPSAVALVFGRPSLALDQGSSSTEYCTLNIDKILEPLAEYLPEKVAIDQGVEMDFKSNKREDFVKKVERSNRERNDSNSLGTIIKGSVKDKTHQAQGDLDLRDAETTDNEIASLSGAKLDSNSPKDRIDVS
eukprot:gene16920-8408_t